MAGDTLLLNAYHVVSCRVQPVTDSSCSPAFQQLCGASSWNASWQAHYGAAAVPSACVPAAVVLGAEAAFSRWEVFYLSRRSSIVVSTLHKLIWAGVGCQNAIRKACQNSTPEWNSSTPRVMTAATTNRVIQAVFHLSDVH